MRFEHTANTGWLPACSFGQVVRNRKAGRQNQCRSCSAGQVPYRGQSPLRMGRFWQNPAVGGRAEHVRFSNRPFEVKRFQTIHHRSVDVARGLVLLSGIGTRALPSWDSKTRWNNLCGGLIVRLTIGPSGHANSPHPSSREGHLSTARWSSSFSPIGYDPERFSCCCCGLFSGPAELGAVNPDAVHNHGQPARQRHDRLLHPAAPGDLHGPRLEPGPFF